jgi:hypothetical protein
VLLAVTINPEERVKVVRGPGRAVLQQGAYTPVLIKVVNEAVTTKPLRMTSPQSGIVVAGAAEQSMRRRDRRSLRESEVPGGAPGRFLQAEMVTAAPLTAGLSGLRVEYVLAIGTRPETKTALRASVRRHRRAHGGAGVEMVMWRSRLTTGRVPGIDWLGAT